MTELVQAQLPAPQVQSHDRETVKSLLDEYAATTFRCNHLTAKFKLQRLQAFLIYAGKTPLDSKTLSFFPTWLQSADLGHGAGKGANTIQLYVMEVKAFLRWLYKMDRTSKDLSIYLPKVNGTPPKPPQIFRYDEYRALVDNAVGANSRFRWLMILAWHTGMSLIDCCYLRWASINWNSNPIILKTNRIKLARLGAGSGVFTVPILPNTELYTALIELWEKRQPLGNANDQYVSPESAGAYQWHYSDIRQELRRYIQKVLGKNCGRSFKHFRNSFLSGLANSKMNLALACQLSGHKNPAVFTAYIVPDHTAMAEGVAAALDFMQGTTTKLRIRQP